MSEHESILLLHDFHAARNGRFLCLNGREAVDDYGDPAAEYATLREAAGVFDFSFRSRLCVLGTDRRRFLNGQVTNNVKDLKPGEGCYAALVSSKGRIETDLNIYCLEQELLLDFEPGFTGKISERLDRYIIADDVQLVDVAPHYGLLSVQGPAADAVIQSAFPGLSPPEQPLRFVRNDDQGLGEFYLVSQPRLRSSGFDLFVPVAGARAAAERLVQAAEKTAGGLCGWNSFETARIEAGIPRFGADMDETHLAPETGIESRAISYTKGCYIGQEVIARIRTYGQVARRLCAFEISSSECPAKGDKLFHDGKEIGYITSAAFSPARKGTVALGYVRREANAPGTDLILKTREGEGRARIVQLPS